MLRIWLCIIALLFAAVSESGFVPALSSGEACSQSCPDDDSQGQCSPDCSDCTCCGHPRPVVIAQSALVLVSPPGTVLRLDEDQEPLSADAGDILHVPIAPLA